VVGNYFYDLVTSISAFAINSKNPHSINFTSIEMLGDCAKKLVTMTSNGESGGISPRSTELADQWIILVNAFVHVHTDTSMEIRPKVISTLFETLLKYGKLLSLPLWKRIMVDGLWHMFDKVKVLKSSDNIKKGQTNSTQELLLTETSDTFKSFHEITVLYDSLWSHLSSLLPELLDLMIIFMESENENLAIFGTTAFDTLICNSGGKFTTSQWTAVCSAIQRVLTNTEPLLLRETILNATKSESQEENSNTLDKFLRILQAQCRVRKQIFKVLKDTIITKFYKILDFNHLITLLNSAQYCFQRSSLMNLDHELHDRFEELSKTNNQALFEFQNLVAVDAMYTYLDILFLMQLDDNEEEKIDVAEKCLISTCITIIRTYISHSIQIVPQPDRQKSVTNLRPRTRSTRTAASPKQMVRLKEITEITVPVLLLILEKIFEFPDDKFCSSLESLYSLICDLVMSESYEVRMLVRQTFWRIGNLNVPGFTAPLTQFNESSYVASFSDSKKLDQSPILQRIKSRSVLYESKELEFEKEAENESEVKQEIYRDQPKEAQGTEQQQNVEEPQKTEKLNQESQQGENAQEPVNIKSEQNQLQQEKRPEILAQQEQTQQVQIQKDNQQQETPAQTQQPEVKAEEQNLPTEQQQQEAQQVQLQQTQDDDDFEEQEEQQQQLQGEEDEEFFFKKPDQPQEPNQKEENSQEPRDNIEEQAQVKAEEQQEVVGQAQKESVDESQVQQVEKTQEQPQQEPTQDQQSQEQVQQGATDQETI
jgi:hypothetical protein